MQISNRAGLLGLTTILVACHGGDAITGPSPDLGTMNVGEVRVLTPANIQSGLVLSSGISARDYLIVVGNTDPQHDVVANFVVKGDRSTANSFGISGAQDIGAQSTLQISDFQLARTSQEAIHNRVRAFERRALTLRSSFRPLTSRFKPRRTIRAAAAAVPALGDLINLHVPDASTNNLCTNFIFTQGQVASVSRRAILVVDTIDGPPLTLFPQTVLDSITQEFDNVTYPTDSSYFHNPTDIDGNGRIILLFTGQINKLTPAGAGTIVGGFFFAGDLFPPTQPVGGGPGSFCQESNQAEIFYLLAPDPTGKFGNIRSTASVRQGTRGTIAHEFQHMINAGNRLQNPAVNDFESTWLDEAMAHFAEDAVGRASRGFTDLQTLSFSDILPCNTPCQQANDFNAFFLQNLARLSLWMVHPELASPTSAEADTSLAVRGAAWAIVRYAADNFSNGDPRSLTRKLAAGPDTGVTNFAAATASSVDTLVSGWLVSMAADHLGIPGLNPKYQYRSYNFRSVMPPVANSVAGTPSGAYPLLVKAIGNGNSISSTNRSGTGAYYELAVPANAGDKTIQILDSSGKVANFPGEHIYVLRVQ
jgi:hypothetical protein